MRAADLHPLERERLEALRRLAALDSEPEAIFDSVVDLVAQICHVPISLVSLVDERRQWFKAATGVAVKETPREIAFCAHAILGAEPLVVEDALLDQRFADNPLVTGEPGIRFYAGAPLILSSGLPIGTLCAIDRVPRELSGGQQRALGILANHVVAQLEMRALISELLASKASAASELAFTHRWLASMAHDLRAPFASIIGLAELLIEDFDVLARHENLTYLTELRRAASEGHRLLENLLDLALLKSGAKQVERTTVHVDRLLGKVTALLAGMAERKQVRFQVVADDVVSLSDGRILASILQNLLSNAVKFSHPGGVVRVQARSVADEVVVEVHDGGVGMSPALVARLNGGDAVASTKGTGGETGSGWGLRLCRELGQLCTAQLTLVSTPGQGTTATLRLPTR